MKCPVIILNMLSFIRHTIKYILSKRYRTFCKAHEITEALQEHRRQDAIQTVTTASWREYAETIGKQRMIGVLNQAIKEVKR